MDEKKELVTNRDRDLAALKAAAKLATGNVVGAMIQMYSGKIEESRQRRLTDVLIEVETMLKDRNIKAEVEGNEDYAMLFTEAVDPISTATSDDKRQRLRDLLFNFAQIPQGDAAWEESMYCLNLLRELNPVQLHVLARVAIAERESKRLVVAPHGQPAEWVVATDDELTMLANTPMTSVTSEPYKYGQVLVNQAVHDLARVNGSKRGLLNAESTVVKRYGTAFETQYLSLTPEGQLLVKWTIADF